MRGRHVAALLVLTATADAAAQTVSFDRTDYASSPGARAIVSADFNRDGWPDVAHANNGRNSVTILLNDAAGGLVRAVDVAVGAGPFGLAAGDFNRDGVPDLAVANADGNSISVLLGKGDGTFTRADVAAPGQNPRGIAVADVNRDASPDVIYSAYATGAVQVLNGDGAGGFTKGAAYVSTALSPQGLGTADFNRDGFLDIAVAYASSTGLRILYGNGGTSFTARTITGATHLNVLDVGDFNNDGWMDVAAASTAGNWVTIFGGSSAGLAARYTSVVGSSPRGITVADLNDDGLADIVTANRASNTVSVLLGDPAHRGTFLPAQEFGANSGSRDVVAADFNRDGIVDLATGNEFASRATVLSNATNFERAGFAFRASTRGVAGDFSALLNSVWVADFDRGGKVDIATTSGSAAGISVLFANGLSRLLPVDGGVRALRMADVNADGNMDLFYLTDTSSGVSVGAFVGDGRGQFTAAPLSPPLMGRGGADFLEAGDLNRDGLPDLAYAGLDPATGESVLQLLIGRGDGTFQVATEVSLSRYSYVVSIADVNRDGKPDVVLASGEIWLGNGRGGVAATPIDVPVSAAVDSLADVNRDGYLDLIVHGINYIEIVPGSTSGFGSPVRTTTSYDLDGFAVGDLDVDGKVDVVRGSGDVFFGNGDGTFVFGGRFDFGVPSYGSATSIALADVTGDGLPDILTTWSAGQVRVLENERTNVNTRPTVDAGPDRTIEFIDTAGEDCPAIITAVASDADAHFLTYEWRSPSGQIVSDRADVPVCTDVPGPKVYTVTVSDGRGGVATDSVIVTRVLTKEIVLWTKDNEDIVGRWTLVADPTAAGGMRAYDPNLGAPKVSVPLVDPPSRLVIRFYPEPSLIYKLWFRLKADANSWANDSVWVQFSGAADSSGTPRYQVFTNSGLAINLEECSGCGESGWGWEDDGWGAVDRNGVLLRFPNPDRDAQFLLIQTREDGVSIDQIVLSAEKYLTNRPGTAKNDTTILPATRRR